VARCRSGQGEFYAFGPALGKPGVVHFPLGSGSHHASAAWSASSPDGAGAIACDSWGTEQVCRPAKGGGGGIRGLDQARQRIAELERCLKGASGAQEIDQAAIGRAATSAVQRERVEWQRRLKQDRARLGEIIAAMASTGQALGKIKGLLEETEREWLSRTAVGTTPRSSVNLRPERTAKATNAGVASAETLDGPLKLAAGERRILTALAQYPQGRSKVQVAVFTGYSASGGGFNNYLGALRSRGLIERDADRLMITEAGIQALGSWEPLPAGGALIDHWRNRLGKAERLILEALTEVYPDALTKEEVAAKAGYEPNGGGFNNALGRLRTLELVQGRGELRASNNLFESGLA
jgi:hypothetical protein